MPDLCAPEEIRTEAITRVANAIRAEHQPTEIGNAGGGYNCTCGEPWLERLYRGCQTRHRAESDAARYVDALGDLLPTAMEGRFIGRGLLRRTRYVTDWREPEETE